MTTTDTTPVPFPGDALAEPRPHGGWERRRGVDPRLLPVRPLAPPAVCNALSKGYLRQWMCTAHTPGWHVATAMNGHVVAVWPVVDAIRLAGAR